MLQDSSSAWPAPCAAHSPAPATRGWACTPVEASCAAESAMLRGQMLPTILHIVAWHTLLQLMCRAWPAVCWRPAAAQSDVTQRQEVTGCRTVPTAKPAHCQPCCAQPFACPAVTGLPQAMLSALCSQICSRPLTAECHASRWVLCSGAGRQTTVHLQCAAATSSLDKMVPAAS